MRIAYAVAVAAIALNLGAVAQAQTNVRIRGVITALDGNVLSVKSRDGNDLKIELPNDVAVAVAKSIRFEDIKIGDYVGATTKPVPGGIPVAIEVHYLAPTVPEGQIPWDLEPGTTMTNANVEAMVAATGARELTLRYKGGTQKVLVPEGVPIVRAVPGTRADLSPGEYVFIGAQAAPDGKLSAPRVQVGKEGIRPPQ